MFCKKTNRLNEQHPDKKGTLFAPLFAFPGTFKPSQIASILCLVALVVVRLCDTLKNNFPVVHPVR